MGWQAGLVQSAVNLFSASRGQAWGSQGCWDSPLVSPIALRPCGSTAAFCTSGFWSVKWARQHPCQRAAQACTEQRFEAEGIFRRESKPERPAVDAGGLGWVCRGHVGQGGGQGRRRLWGARLPVEFTPELSACTGLPGGGS